jgi:hypothetical protein
MYLNVIQHDFTQGWVRVQRFSDMLTNESMAGDEARSVLCTSCAMHWSKFQSVRPTRQMILTELRRFHALLSSRHSSWGNMDMLKANPSSHRHVASGAGPGEDVNHHLLCIPLPLEQAVCLSCSWSGTFLAQGSHTGSRRSDDASHCVHSAESDKSDISNIHLRNILLCLHHALLESDLTAAAQYVCLLVSLRAIVPDVVFKAGLHVLANAPIRDADARLTRFLREIAAASTPPRTTPMYLELVRRHVVAGQLVDARRELMDRLAMGRPYDRSAEYLHSLGQTNFLTLLAEVGRQHSFYSRDTEGRANEDSHDGSHVRSSMQGLEGARSDDESVISREEIRPLGAGREETSGGPGAARPEEAGVRARGDAGGLECPDGLGSSCGGSGGVADWCECGRDPERSRAVRGHEAYGEARRRLGRAVEVERCDATAHLLARLLCMGGDFDAAVRPLPAVCICVPLLHFAYAVRPPPQTSRRPCGWHYGTAAGRRDCGPAQLGSRDLRIS